jgi:hypothetical protein
MFKLETIIKEFAISYKYNKIVEKFPELKYWK